MASFKPFRIISVASLFILKAGLFQASASTLEGLSGTLFSPSAQPLGHLGLAVSVSAYGHQDESMIRDNRFYFHHTGNAGDPDTALVQDIQSGTLRGNVGFGLGPYADFGISVPYFVDLIGDTKAKDLSGFSFGDVIISTKLGRSLAGPSVLTSAILGSLSIPSKSTQGFLPKQPGYVVTDSAAGLPRFFSSHKIGGTAQTILTLDLTGLETHPPFRSSLNAGFTHSGLEGSSPKVIFGGGAEWIPLPSLEFFANVQSQTRLSRVGEFAKIGNEFSYAAVGFCATGDDGIYFSVSVQKSLAHRQFHLYNKKISDGIMTYDSRSQPDMSIAFNLGWTGRLTSGDSDKDGISDKEDLCPNEPEDKDGFQDQDGCPELDNDEDSIYDAVDKCPNQAEDRDGFQDEDGCPEPDNDHDGILDAQDKCPNEPEDMDGFEDYDGCPELDNDKDGILDPQDKCPNLAEDKDGFEDEDGCPEPDNDKDKFLDSNDKCPNEAETYNGYEDTDGCPDAPGLQGSGTSPSFQPLEKRTQMPKVKFKGSTPDLLPESFSALDELISRMNLTPDILIEIRSYMDEGADENKAMLLSESRAVTLRNYLIARGVPAEKVLARGMGSRDPIASNHNAAGRAQNRRIEIHRID